jgi:hypothetical protein
MLKHPTCYDAVRLIKFESFLKHLKDFHFDLKVYHPEEEDHTGIFYVVLQDDPLIEDLTWMVNVFKKTFELVDQKDFLDRIRKDNLMGYETAIDKKSYKNEVITDD